MKSLKLFFKRTHTSAKTGLNVREAFQTLLEKMISNHDPENPLPPPSINLSAQQQSRGSGCCG